MNPYWMNEWFYEGTTCPAWFGWALISLIVAIGIAAIISHYFNK